MRITFRCSEDEKSALSRIAKTLGVSESAALRRIVNAMATDLELLADLACDTGGLRNEGSDEQTSLETTVYIHALRLIGALLTSYRDAGDRGQR